MEEKLPTVEYQMFSPQFQHCMLEACPRSASCLRYLAFTLAPPERETLPLLNPAHLAGQDLARCPYYFDDAPGTFVSGLNQAAETLPSAKYTLIRQDLIGTLGRSGYYRFMRGEYWLNAEEQQHVLEIFRQQGVEEHLIYDRQRHLYR
ncbi:MAG: hypothetical protein I8H68_05510 [Flavobacteriia bacterium]|nr:hypothetical protein [Flavobacteriia bacterium]